MDIELLRTFVAVAERGGFTAAARTLNRTQSAVSLQIKRLEAATGTRLLERSARSVRLTRSGETLLGYARRIIALSGEAVAAMADGRLEGTVRVGMLDSHATIELPHILRRFMESYPRVELELETGLTPHLLEQLGERFDLVLGMHPAGSGEGETIRCDQAVWVASKGHALPRDATVPLALYPHGCLFREWALGALERAGRDWRLVYVSQSRAAVEAIVRAGLAVSVFKSTTVPGSLRALGPGDGLPPLPMVEIALHRARRQRSPVVDLFAEFLVEGLRAGGRDASAGV